MLTRFRLAILLLYLQRLLAFGQDAAPQPASNDAASDKPAAAPSAANDPPVERWNLYYQATSIGQRSRNV